MGAEGRVPQLRLWYEHAQRALAPSSASALSFPSKPPATCSALDCCDATILVVHTPVLTEGDWVAGPLPDGLSTLFHLGSALLYLLGPQPTRAGGSTGSRLAAFRLLSVVNWV